MTLKGDAKFKGKLTCGLKNDIRNFVNFCASSRKSGNLHFNGLLLSKHINMTLKSDENIEEKLTLCSKNDILIDIFIFPIMLTRMPCK